MKRMNRRRFVAVTSVTATSVLLVACGNEPLSDEQLNPTQIPDVPGAPPTIAPKTATPGADTPASGEATATDGGGTAAEAIVIEALDTFAFTPNEVDVAPGQTVTLHNVGFAQHNLVVDEWGIETPLLNNDETGDVVIPEDAEVGTSVEFYCSVPGHKESGMIGTFTVVEAGAAAPADAAAEEAPADTAAAGGTGEPILIDALDSFAFEPNEVEVAPGQTITLHNTGFAQHDLVVDEWGIKTELLNNDQTGDVVIPEDAEVGSTVTFYCSVPGHRQSGMEGTFTVVEGGSTAAAVPAQEEATAAEEAPADTAAAGGTGEPILIDALDSFAFEPNEVEVAPGQTITLHNTGFAQHDLVVDEWGIKTELLNNDQTGDVVIPEDAEVGSTVEFYCSVPGHKQSGMIGTFTVVEAGAAAPADAAAEDAPADAAAAPAEAIVIDALDSFAFEPNEVEVSPGQTVTLHNTGFAQHDLVVDEWGIKTDLLNNDQTGDVVIPEDAEVGSTVTFYCSVPGHRQSGMEGTFTVVEGGGSTAAAVPAQEEATAAEEAPADTAAAGGTGEPILIDALDSFAFEPNEVEVSPGQTVTLHNTGFAQHDLVVDEWGIKTDLLNNDQTGDVVIPEDAEVGSTVEFYCSVPGHKQSGMVGTFTVVEGGSTAAAVPAEEEAPATAVAEDVATPAAADNTPQAVTIVGTKWEFQPAEFEIAPGGVITFQNETGMSMGLSAEPWDQNALTPMMKSVPSGGSGEFTVPADANVGDEIEFTSNLTEATNQGMVGKITIVAGNGAVASPVASPAATPAAGSGTVIEVKMLDSFAFEPNEFEAAVGDTLHFINDGFMEHDFAVDEWSDEPMTPFLKSSETADVVVPDVATSGEQYEFYCSVPGHKPAGMVGTITIK